jgi:hypothetical protein
MRIAWLALVALAFAAGCGSGASASPTTLGFVAVPPVGQTIAEELADGRPVFVVRHEDGRVDVFNAVSPRAMPTGLRILLAWCPERRVFVDRSGGAAFDEFGSWLHGPSPSDMVRFVYAGGDGVESIRVLEEVAGEPLRTPGRGDRAPIGPACQQPDSALVYHEYARADALAPAAAVAAGASGWVLVEGQLDGSHASMCGMDSGCPDRADVRGLTTATAAPIGGPPTLFLARVADGALVDLTVVLRPASER